VIVSLTVWETHMAPPNPDDATKDDDHGALTAAETLLRDDFGQAWQHFRHLETMRSQYLAFAFTITLASYAAAITLVANIEKIDSMVVLLTGVFVQLYCLVVGSLYFSVRKIRVVLAHFRRTIEDVRHYFYDRVKTGFDYDTGRLDISRQSYTVLGWRLFRLQTASELILIAFLVVSGVVEAICAVGIFALAPTWWQATLVVILFACVATIVTAVMRFAWVQREDEFSAQAHH
jgi:hypothetical protein